MKRASSALVSYSSSDEEDEGRSKGSIPELKRRKLPPISSSLVVPVPVDNPALHQGRIRTTPHVEGQFAVHVYVSLTLNRRSLLYKTVHDILSDAKTTIPTLLEVWPPGDGTKRPELHISLSRPIFLRAHQREDLKREVKNIARAHLKFPVSFAVLSELVNDEKTRTFLALEVGAGHHELHSLSKALAPALKAIRQQEYYAEPQFHASIAWALLHRPEEDATSISQPPDSICIPNALVDDPSASFAEPAAYETPSPGDLSTIPHLPSDMIVALNAKYGASLSSPKVGAFDVEAITIKIGKEITSWKLAGS